MVWNFRSEGSSLDWERPESWEEPSARPRGPMIRPRFSLVGFCCTLHWQSQWYSFESDCEDLVSSEECFTRSGGSISKTLRLSPWLILLGQLGPLVYYVVHWNLLIAYHSVDKKASTMAELKDSPGVVLMSLMKARLSWQGHVVHRGL